MPSNQLLASAMLLVIATFYKFKLYVIYEHFKAYPLMDLSKLHKIGSIIFLTEHDVPAS